jgi:hypothetical protein
MSLKEQVFGENNMDDYEDILDNWMKNKTKSEK